MFWGFGPTLKRRKLSTVEYFQQGKHHQLPSSYPSRLLVSTIFQLQHKPSVFISASGMSYGGNDTYGNDIDESVQKGTGFLSDVTANWESEAFALKDVRVVTMRISAVLDANGGALHDMAFAYKFYLGGVVGI